MLDSHGELVDRFTAIRFALDNSKHLRERHVLSEPTFFGMTVASYPSSGLAFIGPWGYQRIRCLW